MEKDEEDLLKKVYIDKAKNIIIIPILLIIISIITYIIPVIHNGVIDFGIFLEILSLIFIFIAKKHMENYDEIKSKKFIIFSILPIILLLIYDLINLLILMISCESIIYATYKYFYGDLLLVSYIIVLIEIIKTLSIDKEKMDSFYETMTKGKNINGSWNNELNKYIYAMLFYVISVIPIPVKEITMILDVIVTIIFIIVEFNDARVSQDGFKRIKIDLIIIIVMISIGYLSVFNDIENVENNSNDSLRINYDDISINEIAENAIKVYKSRNPSQFNENSNNFVEIKKGFKKFLKEELKIENIEQEKKNLIVNIYFEQIIFTITKNDITYTTRSRIEVNDKGITVIKM